MQLELLIQAISYLLGLGPVVVLPIVLILLGLAFGQKPGAAIRAGLTIGVGFLGINLVIGLWLGALGPVAQGMVARTGIALDTIDVGWPSAAAIAFGSMVGTLVIPICFTINIIMLATNLTTTMDIDLWNYWHFAFTGALVHYATGDLLLGCLAAAVNAIIVFKLGDWTAKATQEMMEMPGISLPHGFSAVYVPIGIPVKWLIDMVPGLRDVKADPESISKRLGVLGEPIVLGWIIGAVLAILAGLNLAGILQTGFTMAGAMLLLPRMVKILMEGLLPISESVRDFMAKRFAGREVWIGLDSAIATGHPAAIAASLIIVPIAIALMAIVPGNRILLFADLAVFPFMVCMLVPIVGGNVIHAVIMGTLVVAVGLLVGSNMAPEFTGAARAAGFPIPAGVKYISSVCDGMNPMTWLLLQLYKGLGIAATAVVLAVVAAYFVAPKSFKDKVAQLALPRPMKTAGKKT